MSDDSLDTLAIAKAELAKALVPTPSDILTELGPMGQLFFTQQLVYELGLAFASELVDVDDADVLSVGELGIALQAIMAGAGNLTAACIAMGILPPEAAES